MLLDSLGAHCALFGFLLEHSQTQHGLDAREERGDVERLEEDLRSDVSILARVQRRLREQHGVLPISYRSEHEKHQS